MTFSFRLPQRRSRFYVRPLAVGLMSLLVAACSSTATSTVAGGGVSANAAPAALITEPVTEQATKVVSESDESANAEVLAAIAPLQVVYLGETHTTEGDHIAQLQIIEALSAQNDLAIGLEMFQRPFQPALDAYLAGELTEAELIEQSEYESRWGYDWELYAPIIRFAKDNQIPLLALNTPTEVTRQVAGKGLESLSGDALTYIPPVAEIDTTDEAYREAVAGIFNAHGGAGHSLSFENFFAAQVLWDETMAERIAQQLSAEPERQVVVLVGEGHIAYDYGIPNRVERRLPEVEHASIRLIGAEQPTDEDFADFSWITP